MGSSLVLPPFPLAAKTQETEQRPGYEKFEKPGKLVEEARQAYAIFEECQLCPLHCGVNRTKEKEDILAQQRSPWDSASIRNSGRSLP